VAGYKLSQLADLDLDRLYVFGFFTFGEQQADSYAEGLLERLEDIARNPRQWSEVQEISAGLRRSVYNVHSIYYRIKSNELIVVRILGHQDPKRIFER